MIAPPSFECIEPRCQGIARTKIGKTEPQVAERSLEVEPCPLLHQEHCEAGFLENGQSTRGSDTGELDVMLQMNHTELGETGELGV
jgi:hypothetical protein